MFKDLVFFCLMDVKNIRFILAIIMIILLRSSISLKCIKCRSRSKIDSCKTNITRGTKNIIECSTLYKSIKERHFPKMNDSNLKSVCFSKLINTFSLKLVVRSCTISTLDGTNPIDRTCNKRIESMKKSGETGGMECYFCSEDFCNTIPEWPPKNLPKNDRTIVVISEGSILRIGISLYLISYFMLIKSFIF